MQSYKWPLALLAATLGAQAQAQSMNAEAFYQRAAKLKGKGPLAVFQRKEIEALANEANALPSPDPIPSAGRR